MIDLSYTTVVRRGTGVDADRSVHNLLGQSM